MNRNGKIARLPRAIRDELNQRLQDGEDGGTLLPWLNGLPEVQAVLARHFAGVALGKQNLSEWRGGGFAEWSARQEMLADAEELETVAEGRLSDHLATVLGARYASAPRPSVHGRNARKIFGAFFPRGRGQGRSGASFHRPGSPATPGTSVQVPPASCR